MALKLLRTGYYDLVLADGRLGDGTGFEIADLAKIQGAKALIITGCGMEFSGDELERHPYLIKTVRPIEIVKAIERLIASA